MGNLTKHARPPRSGSRWLAITAELRREGTTQQSGKRIRFRCAALSIPAARAHRIELGPGCVRQRPRRQQLQSMTQRKRSQPQWRRVIRWRCIAPAVDQALEAKKRIPGMRRDDDESSIGGEDAARPGERRRLIGEMFEHADEQDELEAVATMHAEIRCVAYSKLQGRASRVSPRARDHSAADIIPSPHAMTSAR
jgi:hypothetical protein